ncbi:3-oxoacyl-[acyl-carrier-protein] reductase FabG [Buchnera aphidicola (Cinara kochiana kochiana)]|uniref:3-oxoacyl-[acyl-carrier-protein] reductase FabG n=1 Tax=Buchnera aphidicola (Cinara kochiana kochiana) TaxID=2518976 RepID=A0A451D5P3_9GAMM|nr:3-oxoacyl-ACP reductase FabG [Buchnera aphidicola]VFP81136.1 3-oxoacyl-[acyl-carrier-protein] reductase FabG [Buchnera aphidicola (Cinara kochiana kochiana)]
MKKKIALVTGANKGIGKKISLELANLGIYVIGTATTEIGINKIKKILKNKGIGILINFIDIPATKKKIKKLISKYKIIDIFVHNAGIINDNLLITMPDIKWNTVIDINLSTIFHITKIIIPPMMKQKYGRIIVISSVIACIGQKGQTNYAASKSGLIGFSKSLALEVASQGITVNLVSPGYIITDMTKKILSLQKNKIIKKIPMKRCGTPQDIAYVVSFLSSERSSYITGQNIHVNGGMYIDLAT